MGGDESCLRAANPTKGASRRRQETRQEGREGGEVRPRPSAERGRSLCSFLQTKFMSPSSSPSYPAARRLFLPSAKGPLLSLCSLLPARKPKCCFFFLRLRKVENPSVFQSVRRTPRRQRGERGGEGLSPATPLPLTYIYPLVLLRGMHL